MGYHFSATNQYIDYGTANVGGGGPCDTWQIGDIAIGFWIKLLSTANPSNEEVCGQQGDFFGINPVTCKIADNAGRAGSEGYGVLCQHGIGGSGSESVICIPGLVNPAYKWSLNQSLYFGFSRSLSAQNYYSFFGSRSAMIDGPTHHFTTNPIAFIGSVLPFIIGRGLRTVVGPFSYWRRFLTRQEHQLLAQCQLPSDTSGLLIWTKMFEGAADLSTCMRTVTFHNNPEYVPDSGCTPVGTGEDYSLRTAD